MVRLDCGDDAPKLELYFTDFVTLQFRHSQRIHNIVGGCCGEGGVTSGCDGGNSCGWLGSAGSSTTGGISGLGLPGGCSRGGSVGVPGVGGGISGGSVLG
jgi:hypothetical protein